MGSILWLDAARLKSIKKMSLVYHVFLFSLTAAFWMAQKSAYEPVTSPRNKPIVTFFSSFIGDAFHKRGKERVQILPDAMPEVVSQNWAICTVCTATGHIKSKDLGLKQRSKQILVEIT